MASAFALGQPIWKVSDVTELAGSWRIAAATEPSAKELGIHAYFFSPAGELILSSVVGSGIERALLTWKRAGEALIVDQPSAPRVTTSRLLLASHHTLQIGDSWYVRELGPLLDEEAPWWALVAGGVWYGVENAGSEPFVPFLMLESGDTRRLVRVVARSAAEAEATAPALLAAEAYERAVWVRDGRVSTADGKLDAVLATRFEVGGRQGSTHSLPYRHEAGRSRIIGGLLTSSEPVPVAGTS